MQRLLITGIVVLPFYEILLMLLPSDNVSFLDSRIHKAALSLLLVLPCVFIGLRKGLKPLPNIWLAGIVGAVWASQLFGPRVFLPVDGGRLLAEWNWGPIAVASIMLLFFLSVYSEELSREKIISAMLWAGGIMAVYALLQSAGFDQFQQRNLNDINYHHVTAPLVGGNLGQSSLLAPFLAMLTPLALEKNIFLAALLAGATIATQSTIGLIALAGGVLFYFLGKSRAGSATFLAICLLAGVLGVANIERAKPLANGRFEVWERVIKDINQPIYKDSTRVFPYTGKGFGAFSYLYSHKHNDTFFQAHNEPLEFLWGCGILGGVMYILAHVKLGWDYFRGNKDSALMASFVATSLASLGTFVYHLAVYQVYTLIILALFYQRRKEHVYCK